MSNITDTKNFRIFVATWNVGGRSPHDGLNLDSFLHTDDQIDIYVLGFQEIVPLSAGNVLVMEDNQPAAKWLYLINQMLNKSQSIDATSSPTTSCNYIIPFHSRASSTMPSLSSENSNSTSGLHFFHGTSLKTVSRNFRTDRGKWLKTCNCPSEGEKKHKESCFRCQETIERKVCPSSDYGDSSGHFVVTTNTATKQLNYCLIASKQMVGIFVTIWVRKELIQYIGHLRLSCTGRGIMGCLGNKGCISVSMSLHQTSFCFVCSHLASGEKESDQLRRNLDVIEILKNTQFPNICKKPDSWIPEKILEHDRVIWLGDLNYRIALSYSETQKLLKDNDWDSLLEKDQLKMEQEAGRVFKGWKEGKISFAPTYKYSNNSDAYAGETPTSKKKRTPAWCDRILWHGDGIEQLCYIRGESRFSDHRPVCAVFMVEVVVVNGRLKKRSSRSNVKVEAEETLLPCSRYLALKSMY